MYFAILFSILCIFFFQVKFSSKTIPINPMCSLLFIILFIIDIKRWKFKRDVITNAWFMEKPCISFYLMIIYLQKTSHIHFEVLYLHFEIIYLH